MCSLLNSPVVVQLLSVYDHTSSWHKLSTDQWCVLPPCAVLHENNRSWPLTFLRAEPEPISDGISSVQAALMCHIMQRPQWLQTNHTFLVPSTHTQNDTAIPSIITGRPNARTAEQHARWVEKREEMGVEGYILGRKGFWKTNKGIFSSLDHKCR